ncbi:hypothetical protein OH809_02590 [Streptomyces sp. NBC_00873]|uniref:hypothetical protein n=1 Tax=unclassified Streptomyces TaxID=2593676 RepID=UPI0038679B1C|nr:hypothetical protein OH809_02590 [Streptomyces sp. NBC_00873]WTA48199.1 hypothetical protein OH821_41220 [Streptomyces sp. NBC_00842]
MTTIDELISVRTRHRTCGCTTKGMLPVLVKRPAVHHRVQRLGGGWGAVCDGGGKPIVVRCHVVSEVTEDGLDQLVVAGAGEGAGDRGVEQKGAQGRTHKISPRRRQ